MSETCTIKITMNSDESRHYGEEDIVKQVWPYMQPWFTRRHGAEKGRIEINDVLVIEWKYESTLDAALKDKP